MTNSTDNSAKPTFSVNEPTIDLINFGDTWTENDKINFGQIEKL
jgi:hypothetical protein